MLREYHAVWRALFILLDLAVSLAAFAVAYGVRFGLPVIGRLFGDPSPPPPFPPLATYSQVLPILGLVLWITNSQFRLYRPRRTGSFVDEARDVCKSSLAAVVVLMTFFFFDRTYPYARSLVVIFALLHPTLAILMRLVLRGALRHLRSRGRNLRWVLIVGTGRTAQELMHRLRQNPWTGIRVRGLISRARALVGRRIHSVPVIGCVRDMDRLLDLFPSDQVYIAVPFSEKRLVEGLVKRLTERLVAVRIVPDVGYYVEPHHLSNFDGLPVLHVWENRLTGWNAFVKRSLDVALASLASIACLPLFLVIAALVKLTSPGPILYVQQRMGLDGRIFPILKFRTMRCDADRVEGWTLPEDERCTGFGRLLRRTSLDELPQLVNVLAGQMSVVGPRPERPVLIEKFRRTMPQYMLRHQVKAGMTGWAQVNGWRGNTSLRKRLQYDLYYARHWSIWFDLKILALTVMRGLVHRNAY